MIKSIISTLVLVLFAAGAHGALPTKDRQASKQQASSEINPQAYEKLTGKKFSQKTRKQNSSPQRALALARESRQSGDYVLALKRYNFVMKYYPRSAEAKMAVKDKAAMYSQMGLKAPAEHNQKLLQSLDAREARKKRVTTSATKSENKPAPKKQSKAKSGTVKR